MAIKAPVSSWRMTRTGNRGAELEGYADYASRVCYRFIPMIW